MEGIGSLQGLNVLGTKRAYVKADIHQYFVRDSNSAFESHGP
jgi:hypothetical protein